jgi:type II secretory pathway pseudopilin PulG
MKKRCVVRNQKGFTLIELISIMIIMGVMGSVAVKKVDFMTDTASTEALALAVKELRAFVILTFRYRQFFESFLGY